MKFIMTSWRYYVDRRQRNPKELKRVVVPISFRAYSLEVILEQDETLTKTNVLRFWICSKWMMSKNELEIVSNSKFYARFITYELSLRPVFPLHIVVILRRFLSLWSFRAEGASD